MSNSKCPHCHVKLGNFMYADACPHCHKELVHNNTSKFTFMARKDSLPPTTIFPFPFFRWCLRMVES